MEPLNVYGRTDARTLTSSCSANIIRMHAGTVPVGYGVSVCQPTCVPRAMTSRMWCNCKVRWFYKDYLLKMGGFCILQKICACRSACTGVENLQQCLTCFLTNSHLCIFCSYKCLGGT